jgi:hypothetical protein
MCGALLGHVPDSLDTRRSTTMSLRTLLASALVALSVMAGGASAFAASNTGEYDSYPGWAQHAFEPDGGE